MKTNYILFLGFLGLLLITPITCLRAQVINDSIPADSTDIAIEIQQDSIPVGDIKTTITYYAEDSIVSNMVNNTIYLYGKAKVNYGDVALDAAEIEIDQNTHIITARGVPDSTGKLQDTPAFKQGNHQYQADSMRYNFETQKGVISAVVTQEGEGFIHSEKAKRDDKGMMYAARSRYTTCNLKHPHWYISASKIKMIPEKQVVSGPFHMVISDVPTPLGFAFGIFPFTNKRTSGVIIPTYGEEQNRGFFLRQGGYFWAINEYAVAEFLGDIYTNGSWGVSSRLQYRKRYHYSGTASVRFNKNVSGDEGETRTSSQDFWINWSHSPIPRGNSSFTASVNFGTSQFNDLNAFSRERRLSNSFNSSISYNTRFDIKGTTATMGLNIRHDQNSNTNIMNLTAPEFNFSLSRIYPFKKKGQTAKGPLQKINIGYSFNATARFSNSTVSYTSFPFDTITNLPVNSEGVALLTTEEYDFNGENLSKIIKNAQIGGVHRIPISTTVKLLKFFSLNPSFNYIENWYPKKLKYVPEGNANGIRIDTIPQLSRTYSWSTGASLTTRVYGIYTIKGKRLEAIRHTMIPTVGVNYTPDLSNNPNFFYKYIDNSQIERNVSRFQGFNPSPTISSREAGSLSFSLQNNLEAKIRPKVDSTDQEFKKVMLLDNLSFNGNYDLTADEFNLSTISIAARTRLFSLVDFNFTGNLDPYLYTLNSRSEDGTPSSTRRDRYWWQEKAGIGEIRSFNISLRTSLTPQSFKKATQAKLDQAADRVNNSENDALGEDERRELQAIENNPDLYVDFDIPWTLSLGFNITQNKQPFAKASYRPIMDVSGDVSITKTWKIGFRTGYDFDQKKISLTNIDIYKDLHCWEMRFNWVPLGQWQSYSFELRIKSSLLQDLKISKRRNWLDNR